MPSVETWRDLSDRTNLHAWYVSVFGDWYPTTEDLQRILEHMQRVPVSDDFTTEPLGGRVKISDELRPAEWFGTKGQ